MTTHPIALVEANIGKRLDVVIAQQVDGVSRRRAQYLIGAGIARLNGEPATKSTRLAVGDRVSFTEPVGPDFTPAPHRLDAVETLYDDELTRIVSKPRGIACFGTHAKDAPAVANHLMSLDPEPPLIGPERRRAGLVNVLEPSVSGVLVAAKTSHAFDVIRNHLFTGRAWATIALGVTGTPPETDAFLRVGEQRDGFCEMQIVLEPGAKQWPVRLTRPLLPQLRKILEPHGLQIVGDGGSDPRPAVHLESLCISHRTFAAEASMPAPQDWTAT